MLVSGVSATADGVTDDFNEDNVIDPKGYYIIPIEGNENNYSITLTETPQEGWINTYDGDQPGTAANYTTVLAFQARQGQTQLVLPVGDFGVTEKLNFGNTQYGKISGYKYEDLDGSNTTTGDRSGEDNWTVKLYLASQYNAATGVFTGAAVQTAVTGTGAWADGYYEFLNLVPGNYVLAEEDKTGWVNVTPKVIVVDPLTSGETDFTGNDFVNTQYGKISGFKYEDLDGSNTTTGDRSGEDNWTVKLYLASQYDAATGVFTGAAVQTAVTGTGAWADGYYEFLNLVPGNYVLAEEDKTGWFNVTPKVIVVETLTSGETDDTGNNFANTQYGKISGFKYEDLDGSTPRPATARARTTGRSSCIWRASTMRRRACSPGLRCRLR